MTLLPTLLLTIVVLVGASAPGNEPDPFDVHLERAQSAFGLERYSEAADELEAAFALSADDDVLFNWANAERLAGDCPRAIQLYDRYLGLVRDDVAAGDELTVRYSQTARQRRDECLESGSVESPDAPAQAVDVPPPPRIDTAQDGARPPPSPDRPQPTESRRRWADPVGWSLTGVGVATLAAGGGLLGAGFSREPAAMDGSSHSTYLDDVKKASRLEAAGWSLLGVGSALVVGGVVRLVLVSRRKPSKAGRGATGARGPMVRF